MSFDFIIQQGATWRKTVTWFPGGQQAVLRGATARLQVRASPQDDDLVLDLNSADGSLTINPDTGSIRRRVMLRLQNPACGQRR